MEIVGIQWRAAITVLYQIPFSLGHLSLAGLAFWFRHWQQLQIAITLPSIILLSYWWLVPESPRWLLAMERQKEACKILQKAAGINKVQNVDIAEVIRKHCLQQVRNERDDCPPLGRAIPLDRSRVDASELRNQFNITSHFEKQMVDICNRNQCERNYSQRSPPSFAASATVTTTACHTNVAVTTFAPEQEDAVGVEIDCVRKV